VTFSDNYARLRVAAVLIVRIRDAQ
jgi:hypothetical protein